ncbi:MAG: hypothetical protein FJ146_12015 [Deltaproteobacteria bacterium]|nr:hypothetical protein [Deltaproteobacteria bacterium]
MTRIFLAILRAFFRLRMTVRPIAPGDTEAVARLLAEQFAYREPLTRQLGLSSQELLPLISAHIDYCAQGKLGVVAHSHGGTLLGVITAEDDFRPFVPPEDLLTPRLRMVGDVLGRVSLPNAWIPQSERELFYCDLAATDPQYADKHVLAALTLGIFDHLSAMGFKRGYAKVTNERMMARLRGFERLLWRPIFTELCRQRSAAGSEVIAVGWSLDFWQSRFKARVSSINFGEKKR